MSESTPRRPLTAQRNGADNKLRRPIMAQRHDLEDFTDSPSAPSPEQAAVNEPIAFSFTGKRGQLFKIALVNSLLTILTLGIYRFWAKTRIRRYFWSNIRIQNEPLEYTGTAMELLIGFLVVLAILVPIFAVYQGVLFLTSSSPEELHFSLQILYAVALLGFFQYAFYRMWRYRFSRTTWRSIRFSQAGSAWAYMGITLGWLVVTITTLGIAYPWLRHAQWQYRIKHMHFGEQAFTYSGRARFLAKKWLVILPIPFLLLTVLVVFQYQTLMTLMANFPPETPDRARQFNIDFQELGWLASLVGLTFLAWPFLYVWYRIQELNYIFGQSKFGDSGFRTSIRASVLIGWFFAMLLGMIFFIGIPTGFVTYAILTMGSQLHIPGIPTVALLIIGFVLILVATSIISTVILTFGITKHMFSNIQITNPQSLMSVSQAKTGEPEFGEGLADALDVGAF